MAKIKRQTTTHCKLNRTETDHLRSILEKIKRRPPGFGNDPFTEKERQLIESLHKQLQDE